MFNIIILLKVINQIKTFMYYKNLDEFMSLSGYVIDGKWYPRVTAIVSIKSKPALYKFYGEAASFSDALSVGRKSATEGTRIHNAVEAILMGKKIETNKFIQPAIDAFVNFRMLNNLEVSRGATEKRIFSSTHRYAGTVDALALINGKFGILDIKTSSGIWRDYNLQTSAYMAAMQEPETWGELKKRPIETRWILRLDQFYVCSHCGAKKRMKGGRETIRAGYEYCNHLWEDLRGEWELKELTDFDSDFKAFLAAKTLWEWDNEYWLKQIRYL
jgi:hypothetical protein